MTATVGPIGRLGAWSATHGRIVAVIWVVLIVGLGALAPRVETALSGAGWEDSGSESVQVREVAQDAFGGNASSALSVVVSSDTLTVDDLADTLLALVCARWLHCGPPMNTTPDTPSVIGLVGEPPEPALSSARHCAVRVPPGTWSPTR